MRTLETYMVVDIGGTNLRAGVVNELGQLLTVKRTQSINYIHNPALTQEELQLIFVKSIVDLFNNFTLEGFTPEGVCVSFPGPVNKCGEVLSAATLWGKSKGRYPLKKHLMELLPNREVVIINDITAAAWRYVDEVQNDFCVITVSSGIGNKIIRNREVLLSNEGYGGEMGHFYYGGKYKSLVCDCGDKGHIGAISSGRGVENLIKILKLEKNELFKASSLSDKNKITTYDIIEPLKFNDPFAIYVLRESLKPLAKSITFLYSSIGLRNFVIIGGFAQAVGKKYTEMLKHLVDEITPTNVYGQPVEIKIIKGKDDDNNGLIGAGKYILEKQMKRSVII